MVPVQLAKKGRQGSINDAANAGQLLVIRSFKLVRIVPGGCGLKAKGSVHDASAQVT
jgi:hypothetical protein